MPIPIHYGNLIILNQPAWGWARRGRGAAAPPPPVKKCVCIYIYIYIYVPLCHPLRAGNQRWRPPRRSSGVG